MSKRFKSFFTTVVASKDRFLKKDKPTEAVFQDLFDSVNFRRESADTAKTTEQGLVKIPSNVEIDARDDVDTDGFALFMSPETSPVTAQGTGDITVVQTQAADGHLIYTVNNTNTSSVAYGAWNDIADAGAGVGNGEYGPNEYAPALLWSAPLRHRLSLLNAAGTSGMVELRGGVLLSLQVDVMNTPLVIDLPASIRPTHDLYWNSQSWTPGANEMQACILRLTTTGTIDYHSSEQNSISGDNIIFLDKTYQIG